MNKKIGVIGGGSWGTAISYLLAKNNNDVLLWSRNIDVVQSINQNHINDYYFDDINLPNNILATNLISDIEDCDYIFLVIPTQSIREFFLQNKIPSKTPIILCNKGIELNSLKFTSEIISEYTQNEVLILSGPNFAREIMHDLPARANIIGANQDIKDNIKKILTQDKFTLTCWSDLIGAEICGALKNVLAIGCGILQGMKLGENIKAAFITEGIEEISKLIKAKAGNIETLLQYCGIGDILLTCNSHLSRNMSFGYNFVQSGKQNAKTVEGVYTAHAISLLADKLNLDMPIMKTIYNILYLQENVQSLLNIK